MRPSTTRRRNVAASAKGGWREAWRIARPWLFSSVLILVIGCFVIAFEYLPQRSHDADEKPQITRMARELMIDSWRGLKQRVKKAKARMPGWVPTWRVKMPTGHIDSRFPKYEELLEDAQRVLPLLDNLKRHTFFRLFKAELGRDCPFWAKEGMCLNPQACSVCECTEDQIPKPWKMKPIENFIDRSHYNASQPSTWSNGQLEEAEDTEDFLGVSAFSSDLNTLIGGWDPTGLPGVERKESKGDASYVDLTLNRPGFTAYRGRNIWSLIYRENCMGHKANPLERSSDSTGADKCTEEEVFYRIVSGMQTCIMVLSAEYHRSKMTPQEKEAAVKKGMFMDDKKYRQLTSYNLELFRDRVAPVSSWSENLYFTFGILLRSLCQAAPIMEEVQCDTGAPNEDAAARAELMKLLQTRFHACRPELLREAERHPLFDRKQQLALRQFRNISRIMDCLECEKCRLHGKVKIAALMVALKASGPGGVRQLERNEVIGLINALSYFADSLVIIARFRRRLYFIRILWALPFTMLCVATPFAYRALRRVFGRSRNRGVAMLQQQQQLATKKRPQHGGGEVEPTLSDSPSLRKAKKARK